MSRFTLALVTLFALSAAAASELEAQRNCTRGKPCGNTCIAVNRTCHVGTPQRTPPPPPPTRAAPTAPPVTPMPEAKPAETTKVGALTLPGVPGYVALDTIELLEVQAARLRAIERMGGAPVSQPSAAAATSATSGPWTASRAGSTYYRTGCSGGNALVERNRIYFQSEEEARTAGYRRSTARGC